MIKPHDLTGYKPSPQLLETLIWSNELAIMALTGRTDESATQAIVVMKNEIARFRAALEGEMLVRITGGDFVAGVVFDESGYVYRCAPKVKWAMQMTQDQLRAEIDRRGLKATIVRTLTAQEIEAE